VAHAPFANVGSSSDTGLPRIGVFSRFDRRAEPAGKRRKDEIAVSEPVATSGDAKKMLDASAVE
jgi:hypothetical protein